MGDISTWTWPTIFVALTALALITVLVGLIAYALLRSSSLPAPALLVTSMSMLTLVLVVVYAITKESDLLTLVGVPVGALAAATSSVYVAQHAPMSGGQSSRVTVAGSAPGQETPAMTIDVNPGPTGPASPDRWHPSHTTATTDPAEGADDNRGA